MSTNGISENYQNGNLKIMIYFGRFLGSNTCFYSLNKKEQVLEFLNTRTKDKESDPDKRWTRTWNDYLQRIKYFIRWLYNQKAKENKGEEPLPKSEWSTPGFVKIQEKRTKRISPYLESELWDRDELLSVMQYEKYKRNKAALTLLWDLNGRNHEVTLLQIKHIQLKERYGEGEIPYESKTGTGPVLLTCSFPYVRDWLNEHPFRNERNARLICNINTGARIKPDALCTVMKQLRKRIIRLLETGSITDEKEKPRLEFLLKTKRWNPYCIRHSAITSDSDFLPEYALKKKVRWSMNSKQGSRYIKRRMGGDLKNQILVRNGIITDEYASKQPSVLSCHRCSLVNVIDNKFCSKCSYPLTPQAYEEIKANEDLKLKSIQDKHEQDMKAMREELVEMQQAVYPLLQNSQFAQIRAQVDKQVSQDPTQFVMEKLSAAKPIPVVKTKLEKMAKGGYRLARHVDNHHV
jgi:integrase/recombinase XerD